ncbi:MAG: TlpA disulfide reductase family protein [Bacteroidota bacterium]
MKYKLLLILFIFCTVISFSQKISIRGIAPGAGGRYITLTKPSDLVTNTDQLLAKEKIDTNGRFSISAVVEKTFLGRLSIDFHTVDFFIEPGKTYEVSIAPYKYDDVKELNPFINATNLQIKLVGLPADDINYILAEFDGIYNAFLVEHFNSLYRDHNRSLLDTLNTKLRQAIGNPADPYIRNYMEYKLANVIQLTQAMNQAGIGYSYFTTKPVLYDNVEYMDFFNSYFSKYLVATSRLLKKNDYHALLTAPDPYAALMKALLADSILKPEPLRELVLLKGLMEMYASAPPDDQRQIISVLKFVEMKGKDQNSRVTATNIIKSLTNLQPGSPAPKFRLKDKYDNFVKLDSLKGQIVVLNFWTSYCTGCTDEMDLIRPLADKYKGKVAFVSISSEYYWIKMLYFVNLKKDWNWTFLHIGNQIDVLKAYDVRSLPLFVIIDKLGNIYKYPADFPGNGLEKSIEQLLQSSK